jgi:hypothetical protein
VRTQQAPASLSFAHSHASTRHRALAAACCRRYSPMIPDVRCLASSTSSTDGTYSGRAISSTLSKNLGTAQGSGREKWARRVHTSNITMPTATRRQGACPRPRSGAASDHARRHRVADLECRAPRGEGRARGRVPPEARDRLGEPVVQARLVRGARHNDRRLRRLRGGRCRSAITRTELVAS